MESIYLGLANQRNYIFLTNDIFGDGEHDCAIARVNKYCGALIVTAKGDFLIRVREVLAKCLPSIAEADGISDSLSKSLVEKFGKVFQENPYYRENPLLK